jgi:hypothetical protein
MSIDGWLEAFDPASDVNPDEELRVALRGALDPSHADASPDSLDDAVAAIVDSMSADEAVNVTGAMRTIGRQASVAASNPVVAQAARAGLPAAGAALGSIGGPLGTVAGARLGSAVSRSLAAPKEQPAPARVGRVPADPSVTQGSRAAARALVLTQHPRVLQSLLALALGAEGAKTVEDVPVERVMRVLRAVFVQAEADAVALAALTAPRSATDQAKTARSGDEASELYLGMAGRANRSNGDWLNW